MKRLWGLLILILLIPSAVFALDLTVKGGLGNTAFNSNRRTPLDDRKFEGAYFPFGAVLLEGTYSDLITYRAGFERDPVLRNRLSADVGFNFDYIRLTLGPFAGPFNNWTRIITPGVSAGLTLEWPGILFGSLSAGSTIGAGINSPGDYVQQNGTIALGFWVPHVVNTLSVSLKTYTEQVNGALRTEDQLLRYQYTADVFAKNVPYTVRIDMGYQSLKRSYTIDGGGGSDTLKSVFLGFETTVRINPFVKVLLGAETPVYAWGEKPLGNPGNAVLFQAHTGVILTFLKKQP
jgi:hypothetical protein